MLDAGRVVSSRRVVRTVSAVIFGKTRNESVTGHQKKPGK
jgi:hypothetical protein